MHVKTYLSVVIDRNAKCAFELSDHVRYQRVFEVRKVGNDEE